MSSSSGRVVVVGASMGGLRAAEGLRKAGYVGEVLVIGEERHMPYNRPPLSKAALADEPDLTTLAFRVPRAVKDVTWRLGQRVNTADLDARTVTLAGGEVLGWEGLVVATGLRPRRLATPGPLEGRHVIRTLEDAIRLRAALAPGARLVIVGAGFIGAEVAATTRSLGVEVDVVAPEAVPMERPLQHDLGAALQRRHEAHGVRFHLGAVPIEFRGRGGGDAGRVASVLLSDGTELAADVVLEAVGAMPNTEWLDGNGLNLDDGVVCDGRLRVQGRPDVVACGDIAKFPNPLFDDAPRRTEHWTMVTDTARKAGHTLGAHLTAAYEEVTPFMPVPSFWSDQYDLRIQSFGAVGLGGEDVRILEGDLGGEVAMGYYRDRALVGVVLIGLGGRQLAYRDRIAELAGVPTPG